MLKYQEHEKEISERRMLRYQKRQAKMEEKITELQRNTCTKEEIAVAVKMLQGKTN